MIRRGVHTQPRAHIFVHVRESPIDSCGDKGLRPSTLRGKISFRDVFFNYPARKDVKGKNTHK